MYCQDWYVEKEEKQSYCQYLQNANVPVCSRSFDMSKTFIQFLLTQSIQALK